MTIRIALLTIGIWVILASSTVQSFQATLLRRSDSAATHTALLIKTVHSMSAIDLAILLLLGGLRALVVRQRRRCERRIDLDASLAETVTVVQAWAARERIALRGDEPDAPSLRLREDAPAGRHGPDLLTDPAAFLPCLGFLACALPVPFGLSALVYPCAGLWGRSCHRRHTTRRRTGGFGHPG
jgi:hypothetical protein